MRRTDCPCDLDLSDYFQTYVYASIYHKLAVASTHDAPQCTRYSVIDSCALFTICWARRRLLKYWLPRQAGTTANTCSPA